MNKTPSSSDEPDARNPEAEGSSPLRTVEEHPSGVILGAFLLGVVAALVLPRREPVEDDDVVDDHLEDMHDTFHAFLRAVARRTADAIKTVETKAAEAIRACKAAADRECPKSAD